MRLFLKIPTFVMLVALLTLVLSVGHTGLVLAATFQDFEPGTPINYVPLTQDDPPPPTIMPGGPPGSTQFLRLADTTIVNHNSIAFDLSDPGLFATIEAEFDFRMTPGVGRVDGIGFAFLNTAVYEDAGGVPPGPKFVYEEPSYYGSIGVGFDIHDGGPDLSDPSDNHVSIHFGAGESSFLEAFSIPKETLDLAGSQWIHAKITMRPGGGFSDITVELTPSGGSTSTVVPNLVIPGFDPYEGRVLLGARSGGESADHDIDNIEVRFLEPVSPEPILGQWGNVMDMQVVAIHATLLPTGEVIFWDRTPGGIEPPPADPDFDGNPRIWNPTTNEVRDAMTIGYDIFCSGMSFLADGRLLVAGGHKLDLNGDSRASIYNPYEDSWEPLPDMNAGRWYPTTTALGNGDILVTSGQIEGTVDENGEVIIPFVFNDLPQVWQPATSSWRDLTGAKRVLGYYPWMHLMPNGDVFMSGPSSGAFYLDTSGTGEWTRSNLISNFGNRGDGSSVMYDKGKVLIVGGGGTLREAEVIDLEVPDPAWLEVGPMAFPRRYINATILPDGKVLVTGGTSSPGPDILAEGAVLAAEMWDPETENWSVLAQMQTSWSTWTRNRYTLAIKVGIPSPFLTVQV